MAKGGSDNRPKFGPGEIYSFKTQPVTRFSPPDTGRYGALKILGPAEDNGICFVLLDGVFATPPSAPLVTRLKPMRGRFLNANLKWEEGFESIVVSLQFEPVPQLSEFRLAGSVDLTKADRLIMEQNSSFGGWSWAATTIEIAWRKRNDAKAFEAEYAREEEAREREQQEAVHRQNTRLKNLTLAQLQSEPILPIWNATSYPPLDFAEAVRARIRETIDALQNLGERPRRPAARAILTSLVEWLNAQNEAFDHPIETMEREHLCDVLEELCWAVRQPTLVREIQDLRDW